MRKTAFAYAKTKMQISFAVAAKLISAFVFVTPIVQSLYFLNPKFQASSHRVWFYSPVCVGPGRKPRRLVFSERGSIDVETIALSLPSIPLQTSTLVERWLKDGVNRLLFQLQSYYKFGFVWNVQTVCSGKEKQLT